MSIRIGELTVIHNSRFYLAVHAAESGRRKPGWRESRGNCSLYATRPYLTFHAFIISYHRSSRTSTNDVASVSSLIAGISSFDDDAVRYHEIYAEQYGVSPTTKKIWIFFYSLFWRLCRIQFNYWLLVLFDWIEVLVKVWVEDTKRNYFLKFDSLIIGW